uniref:Shell matrix protein n=1 Tax=Laqueus rubellus TaxID=93892 RepID=A0A3G9CLT2_LAQRU
MRSYFCACGVLLVTIAIVTGQPEPPEPGQKANPCEGLTFNDGCNTCIVEGNEATCEEHQQCTVCHRRYPYGAIWYEDRRSRMCFCGGEEGQVRKICSDSKCGICVPGKAWFKDSCGNVCCCTNTWGKSQVQCSQEQCSGPY